MVSLTPIGCEHSLSETRFHLRVCHWAPRSSLIILSLNGLFWSISFYELLMIGVSSASPAWSLASVSLPGCVAQPSPGCHHLLYLDASFPCYMGPPQLQPRPCPLPFAEGSLLSVSLNDNLSNIFAYLFFQTLASTWLLASVQFFFSNFQIIFCVAVSAGVLCLNNWLSVYNFSICVIPWPWSYF